MARHPEVPGDYRETIGTHRVFQLPCMRRRIYRNRKEESMFEKARSQGALEESEKREPMTRPARRNLLAEGLPEEIARSR